MTLTVQQIQEFVKANAMSHDEATTLANRALDPDYWISTCPWMSINKRRLRPDPVEPSMTDGVAKTLDEYWRSGFSSCEDVFEVADINRLAKTVFAVQNAGWPMAFSFLYDEFWTLLEAPKLRAFLTSILGDRYQPTARFLVNYVPPMPGGSGFAPHVDGGPDHTVSCWMPLTAASPDNGGVYVIERTPASMNLVTDFKNAETFSNDQMMLLLSHARALPMDPGGFLAWQPDTIHWGGMFRRGPARLAVSWEFMGPQHENLDAVLPLALLPDQPLPAFEDRLRWICQCLPRTVVRDVVLERFLPVVEVILADERTQLKSKKAIGA